MDNTNYDDERERLEYVASQIRLELEAGRNAAEKLRRDVTNYQKSIRDEVNPTPAPGDMDDLAFIWQFQTELVREGSKSIFLSRQVDKLAKMLKNPYFARIDFLEDGTDEAEKIYIGISNFTEEQTRQILIYDWRAPVSGMFYDYELGRAGYNCPAGRIDGELQLKRQYRISDGGIQFMFDSSLAINDEILQEILGKSADNKMKTIVTSIQREQNGVIRDENHRLLAVTGPAGSGKTSIALHRAAYLLYRYRKNITSENIIIFSPNDIFSDYISEVLPELGEDNVRRITFYEYAVQTFGQDAVLENAPQQMEYLLNGCKTCGVNKESAKELPEFKSRVNAVQYKASGEIAGCLRRYVELVESSRSFEDVTFNGSTIETGPEIEQYYKDLQFLPVVKRLEKIRNRLTVKLDELIKQRTKEVMTQLADMGEYIDVVEIRAHSLSVVRTEAEPARKAIALMTGMDLFKCYEGFLQKQNLDVSIHSEFTGEGTPRWVIPYEDIAPLLLLNGLLSGFPNRHKIRHVIIDEVQDYTPVQIEIFRELFGGCNLTLLGDPNQSTNPYVTPLEIESVAGLLGAEKSTAIKLKKSYRSTKQIAEFCRRIAHDRIDSESVNRDGKLPEVLCEANLEGLYAAVVKDIGCLKDEGLKSIAVVLRTEADCLRAYEALKKYIPISLITGDRQRFFTGTAVISSYLSKGLEFDAVLVLCPDPGAYQYEEERGLAYTVCSRALHRLNIYCTGGLPHFLERLPQSSYRLVKADE